MSLTHRGVNHDVGTNYGPGGTLTRPVWDLDLVLALRRWSGS
jgi:hypothetical protein